MLLLALTLAVFEHSVKNEKEGTLTPIQPLIPDLAFIEDKQRRGSPFRRGLFRIERPDFARLAATMGVELGEEV